MLCVERHRGAGLRPSGNLEYFGTAGAQCEQEGGGP